MFKHVQPIVERIANEKLKYSIFMDVSQLRQDAVQTALLKIYKGLKTWRENSYFCRWVQVVAAKSIIGESMRLQRQSKIKDNYPESLAEQDAAARRPSMLYRNLKRFGEMVLPELEDRYVEVFRLVILQGERKVDAARRLSITAKTVQNRLDRIYNRLRQFLDDQADSAD